MLPHLLLLLQLLLLLLPPLLLLLPLLPLGALQRRSSLASLQRDLTVVLDAFLWITWTMTSTPNTRRIVGAQPRTVIVCSLDS
jgi:hypothetical protein